MTSQQDQHRSESDLFNFFGPKINAILITSIVLVMLLNLLWLNQLPAVFVDEPWQSNAIWSWIKTGVHFESIHQGSLDQFGLSWVRRPVIGGLPWLAVFALFGPGLTQARVVSWLFAAAMLVLVVAAARQGYSTRTGLAAALILALSFPFVQAAHYARQDMMLSTCILLAFVMARAAMRNERPWLHAAAGLVMGLTVDIHQNGLLLIPGMVGLYFVQYGWKVVKQKGAWMFAIGLTIGVGYYIALHILPDPAVYAKLLQFDLAGSRKAPLLTGDLAIMFRAVIGEFARYGPKRNPVDMLLIFVGAAYLFARRSLADRQLLAFVVCSLVTLTFLNGKKSDLYAILLYPYFILIGIEGVLGLLRASTTSTGRGGFVQTAVRAFLVVIVAASVIRFSADAIDARNYDYYRTVAKIQTAIPAQGRIMGSPMWWFGFVERDYRSTYNLSYYHFYNGLSFMDALRRDKPDYLIQDTLLEVIMSQPGSTGDSEEHDTYRVPPEGFPEFLKKHGRMLTEFTDAYHGHVAVYAIDWSEE